MDPMIIISYSLAGRKNALELTRKIYGYTEFSNNSKYKYQREGILSNVKYEKLSRGSILISKSDEKKVVSGFVKLKLKIKVLTINILDRK